MLCDRCKKEEATVHFTEIINGKVTKHNLCEKCAKELGLEWELPFTPAHFSLADLLSGFIDLAVPKDLEAPRKCPNCGTTYKDFKETGRLGCSECYSTFSDELLPLLKRLHGTAQHVGKIPLAFTRGSALRKSLGKLQKDLEQAVAKEEYEKAAVLRDKIKKLKK